MRPGLSDRRLRAERRLFDVHARLERARQELALHEEQLEVFTEVAEEARVRSLVSETPLANREWQEAKRHAEVMERGLEAARTVVAELEAVQDELIGKLVG